MVSSDTGIYFSWASSSSNEGFPTSLCKRHRPIEARRHLWRLSSPTPAQGRGSCSRLLRAVSSWVFSFSEDGDSTSSSVSMCQGLTTLTTRKLLSPVFHLVPRAHTCLWQMCAVPCMGEWHSIGGHKEVPGGAMKMCSCCSSPHALWERGH